MKQLLYLLLLCMTPMLWGQANIVSQKGDLVKIMIAPESSTFNYNVNESVSFDVALYKYGKLLPGVKIYYEAGPEKMKPLVSGSLTLKDGTGKIKVKGMTKPGFLRCYVKYEENGYVYENTGTAGIDPSAIKPHVAMPDDFSEFWNAELGKLAEIPVNPVVTLMPESCTAGVNVYKVKLDNIPVEGNYLTHVYGILCIPKSGTKYPAILKVPGAGVRPYYGQIAWAEKGFITFEIGINGIPVDLYDSEIYEDLKYGALWRYVYNNMDNREKAYMKRVILSCVRAMDFLTSLEEFDGQNLGIIGGSQGGTLSIITASLDKRIKALAAYYPGMCDMTGYIEDVGGWPHMFTGDFVSSPEKIETVAYYDVVNFSRLLETPGFYAYGYNDNVCPPTSINAALNSMKSEKTVQCFYDASHWAYDEESEEGLNWLFEKLKSN